MSKFIIFSIYLSLPQLTICTIYAIQIDYFNNSFYWFTEYNNYYKYTYVTSENKKCFAR